MRQASAHLIIAQRSWLAGSTAEMPPYDPVPGASMTIAEARRAYDLGMVEIATGRAERIDAGRLYVVQSLYAIPRKVRRRVDRPTFGRGNAGHR